MVCCELEHIILNNYTYNFNLVLLLLIISLTGTTTIEKYDLRTNSWLHIGTMSGRRLQFGVAVVDNKLYVVGGRDGLKTLNTVECFNPVNKTWVVMPPMSTHRHGLGKIFNAI